MSDVRRASAVPVEPQSAYRRHAGTTEVVLVRHGSADVSRSTAVIGGQGDAPLTEAGHRQAQLAVGRLTTTEVDRLFVSTMERARQTAAPFATESGLEPTVLPDLREYFLGTYDGPGFERGMAEGDPVVLDAVARQRFELLPGAETAAAFTERVLRGLAEVVAATGPDRCAVVVTHAVVVAELCRQATGSEPFAFLGVETRSLTTLLATADGGLRLRSFNDTAHLDSHA